MIANNFRLLKYIFIWGCCGVESDCPCALLLVPKHTPQKENKPFFFSLFPSHPVAVAAVRVSPCHSRQPSIISDASALEGDRSSTPSDINSPRHRTHSLCNVRAAHRCTLPSNHLLCSSCRLSCSLAAAVSHFAIVVAELMPVACLQLWLEFMWKPVVVVESVHVSQHVKYHLPSVLWSLSVLVFIACSASLCWLLCSCISLFPSPIPSSSSSLSSLPFFFQSLEDLEEAKRKKKKEKMGLGSLSRVFARGKQRKSLDPGLFDGTSTPDYYIEEDADW